MNQIIKKFLQFFIVTIFALVSTDAFSQNNQSPQQGTSITPQQYSKWVQMTADNFMVTINKTINVTTDQKNAIRKDLVRVRASNNRPDLSNITGFIVAKEAFKMISKNLTPAQLDKLSIFNPLNAN